MDVSFWNGNFHYQTPKVEIRVRGAIQVAPHNLHLYQLSPFFFFIHKSFDHALALRVKKVRAALAS